jgi:hypothetical protein
MPALSLPHFEGAAIRVSIRASLGPHLAATFVPKRQILLDREVFARAGDFERILIHELFHFAWVRLGNPKRLAWESLIRQETVRGELGWSAEWRKEKLRSKDKEERTRAWRHYVCESFCDTAAWIYAGLETHEEFTLRKRARERRRNWFREYIGPGPVSI